MIGISSGARGGLLSVAAVLAIVGLVTLATVVWAVLVDRRGGEHQDGDR